MANELISFEQFCREAVDLFNAELKALTDRRDTGLFIADQMNWERWEFDDVA